MSGTAGASGRGEADFDTVHARVLRFLPDLVRDLGGSPEALLRDAGIEAGAKATYRQVVGLLEAASERLCCPDFGMRLAMRQSGTEMFGPLGRVMTHSKTFEEALAYVCGHAYAHSLAARIWRTADLEQGLTFVGHDLLIEAMPAQSQAMEQILLVGHLSARRMTGGQARVRRVHFRHQPISPLRLYRRRFGCEVRFGENENGVFFSTPDLCASIVAADPRRHQRATRFIEEAFKRRSPPLHAQARGVVMQHLGAGDCNQDAVAAELHLHPRTLQRRLKAEGTSFRAVKDEVRRGVMRYYLERTELDFAHVSERLGFSEQSAMTRACQHWLASTPTQIRRRATLQPRFVS